MSAQADIEALISQGLIDEARAKLSEVDEATAQYLKGRIAWKLGDKAGAIGHYEQAAKLEPDGPGAVALQQVRDIMNFFNKDLYNP